MVKKLKNGISVIKEKLEVIPFSPGIYKMINDTGEVIYVGKAKSLKKRVSSYLQLERLGYRIQNMVANISNIEIIITKTEAEALLLEANLIKKFEPKYNILLKDDKSYPYILITKDHNYPRILKHRGQKKMTGKYYGPFPSANSVNKAIADLQKAFLLRPCSDSFFLSRTRPCIEYQIKRCSAPCVNKITKENYAELVDQAKDFIDGKSREIQEKLVSFMEEESRKMNYEKAGAYRDRIKALNQIQSKQSIHVDVLKDADVIAVVSESGECCVQIFFFRGGNNLGNASFYPKHTEESTEQEILSAFLMQFYSKNPAPSEIVIKQDITDEEKQAIEMVTNNHVKITIAKAGAKFNVLKEVERNAQSGLKDKLINKVKQTEILKELVKIFNLATAPKRIEVYDNSHIMGKYEIGAMIVAGEEGFNKKAYRKFNIKDEAKGKGDDYAMLAQVLKRRFKPSQDMERPDLVLIDGGAGQMSVTLKTLQELGLDKVIKFACIAKGPDRNAGREEFYMPGKEPFSIEYDSPVLYYLQLLRDEAHRFAISSHRNKRSKSMRKSLLDEVLNIGKKRKKILLNHFGSVRAIQEASIEDLLKVETINKKTAEIIYNSFH